MNLRMLPCCLALIISQTSGVVHASCEGCSRGQEIVSQGTANAASTGLNGVAGAAGLAGLQGVPGAPGTPGGLGVPGIPGVPGLAGGLLDYAFIYRAGQVGVPGSSDQSIPGGQAVLFNFDGPIVPTGTFSHASGSANVAIHSTGTYIARYKVIVRLAHTNTVSTFALALDSQVLAGSDRSTSMPTGDASLTMIGETIFRISALPVSGASLLSVINAGGPGNSPGVTTDIGTAITGTAVTSATLFVQKIAN